MEENIYGDLEDFDFSKQLEELQGKNQTQHQQLLTLANQIKSERSKYEELEKVNKNLEENISSLFKTATAEIARKDRIISDLRLELDAVIFQKNARRMKRENENDIENPSPAPIKSEPPEVKSEPPEEIQPSKPMTHAPLLDRNEQMPYNKSSDRKSDYRSRHENYREKNEPYRPEMARARKRSRSRSRDKCRPSSSRYEKNHPSRNPFKPHEDRSTYKLDRSSSMNSYRSNHR